MLRFLPPVRLLELKRRGRFAKGVLVYLADWDPPPSHKANLLKNILRPLIVWRVSAQAGLFARRFCAGHVC